jgi:DNA-binding Xre family transcriptional regulator
MAKRKHEPIAKYESELAWIVNDEELLLAMGLSHGAREVLTLRMIKKWTFEEMAQLLEWSPKELRKEYKDALYAIKEKVSQLIRNRERYKATEAAFGRINYEMEQFNAERASILPLKTQVLLKKELSEIEGISKNVLAVLNDNYVYTVDDALDCSKRELLSYKGFGIKSYSELSKAITALGLVMK